jgi:hypothetical protein
MLHGRHYAAVFEKMRQAIRDTDWPTFNNGRPSYDSLMVGIFRVCSFAAFLLQLK